MTEPQSALIAVVPEAEPAVGSLRRRFDPSAALGVPAHITALYPFRAPDTLDEGTLDTLAECFRRLAPIRFTLTALRRFDSGTLYLAPDPAEPFRQLTLAVWRLFPDHPPYGGQWPDIVPHLSIAHADENGMDPLHAEIAPKLEPLLPIEARLREVTLIQNTTGRWTSRATFPLTGP